MSIEPPRSPNQRSVPGYLLVLAAFSVLLLLFSLAVGLVAFGVIDLGDDDADVRPTPVAGSEGPLQRSGFTIRESRMDGSMRVVDVNVAVTNTSETEFTNVMMLVQCLDGGNVSSSLLIPSIAPNETRRFNMSLGGTGDPKCTEPEIGFDID